MSLRTTSPYLKAVLWAGLLFTVLFAAAAVLTQSPARPVLSALFAPGLAVQRLAVAFPGVLSQGTWHFLAAAAQFGACFVVVLTVRVLGVRRRGNDI